ncbi:MAG: porin [Comamonadaceae bacterium]|nr:porin [Comamonadaceae bacterium]
MNKKTLIALAALAAGSAALAQSSVTLYGVADVGIGKGEGGKVNMISSTIGNHTSSHIGLRGVEDMGGGLKAGFNFEQAINMENGATGVADSTTWQRAANVWLGGNWGRFQMGRATTPSFNAMQTWDLMGLPGYAPAYFSFGFVGGDTGDRIDSLFSYKTPVWGGFSAELGYFAKGDDPLGNASSKRDKFDLGVTYVNGPLSAGVAYNKTKGYKANYGLGAKYNFGSFTLAASYQDSNNWAYANTPGAVGRVAGVTLGGMVNFGAMSVALDVVRPLKNEATFQNVTYKQKKYTNGALELKYALSKRTFFYGAYLRAEGTNNYSLGMQHRF